MSAWRISPLARARRMTYPRPLLAVWAAYGNSFAREPGKPMLRAIGYAIGASAVAYSLFRFAGHGFRELSHHGGEVQVERRIYLVGGWISVGCHDLTHD